MEAQGEFLGFFIREMSENVFIILTLKKSELESN